MAKSLKLTTLSVLLAMGIAPMALAQSPQAQCMMGWGMMGPGAWSNGMMGPGMHGMMGYGMMGPGMMMGYGPVMDGQLAYLKAELGITDAQAQAWDDYVKAVKDRATAMQSMHATMMQAMQSGTALERMQAHIQAMQSILDSMKAVTPATEALYKALSDDQKKKADLLLGAGCCML
jgi:LTXXQ motif family protein